MAEKGVSLDIYIYLFLYLFIPEILCFSLFQYFRRLKISKLINKKSFFFCNGISHKGITPSRLIVSKTATWSERCKEFLLLLRIYEVLLNVAR